MMRRFLLLTTALFGIAAAAQDPEELYGEYITPETRAIIERFNEAERRSQEAEAESKSRRTMALTGAILIGLIPLGYIGWDIVRNKTWRDNPAGTAKALGVGLAGSVVLFCLNYGVFLLKIRMGDGFNTAFALLITVALTAGCIYLLKK